MDAVNIDGLPPAGEKTRERQSRREKYRRLRSKAREQHVDYIRGIGPVPIQSSSPGQGDTPSLGSRHGDDVNINNANEYGRVWDVSVYNNGHAPQHGDIRLDERNRDANSNYARIVRKKHPRRHTVGGATLTSQEHEGEDNTRKRQAFMDMLAQRYPQYSEKISGTASEDGYPVRTRRPRDHQRRRTVVTYNPDHNSSLEYEDPETMSNIEGPIGNFSRGGFIRSSLPIVRSPPNTFDRPLGIVFLIYGSETKKAVLPNEITHLDTVRALFVRSFPGRLSMQYLQSSKRKIYILESKTNIYYLLEDLRDIKDRTVLKIHEYESDELQRVREQTPEVRGKSTAPPLRDDTPQQVPDHHHGDTPATAITDQVRKAQTLPQSSNMARSYPPFIDGYPIELERPKSHTLDSARGQPRGHPSATYARITHQSPDRQLASPDRNLRPIPENIQAQNGYMQGNTYEDYDYPYQPIYAIHNYPGHPAGPLLRSMSPPAQRTQPPPGDPIRRAMSPPPSAFSQNYDQFRAPGGPGAPGAPPQTYVAKSMKAATGVHPSRATGPGGGSAPHSNRHSLAFTPMTDTNVAHGVPVHQRSQSYRVSPEKEPQYMVPVRPRSVTPQPLIHDVETKFRMDQMEAQIANLAAWVQTAVTSNESSRASSVRSTTPSEVIGSNIGKPEPDKAVCTKGVSDVSSSSQHTVTQDIKDSILTIKKQTGDLRTDLRSIRRMQQLNKESMHDSIQETMGKIKKVLAVVPGTEQLVLRKQRSELDMLYHDYEKDKKAVMEELHDLESSVEETRADVITHQCRVNLSDVEGMALILSHITKSLGDLKSKFSNLQAKMKEIMAGEMEIVVKEEKYLKDEPDRMEEALKRCKKLTGTLFTLKRLASVQEHRPPQMPVGLCMGGKIPSFEDKKAVLENIQAMVPNHDARLQSLEAADASRERKKKIVTQQEALKFGKSLEIASKGLKPPLTKEPTIREVTSSTSHTVSSVSSSSTTTKSTSSASSASKFSLPLSLAPDKHSSSSSRHSHKPKISSHSASPPRTDKSGDGKSSGTVVSSAAEDDLKNVKISDRNNAARAAFFSSLTTPPTSPSEEKRITSPITSAKMDYTVRISPIRTSSSGETHYAVAKSVPVSSNQPSSTTKPTSLPVSSKKTYNTGYKSSTPSPNSPNIPRAFVKGMVHSNIPRFSGAKPSSSSESSDKSKHSSENVNKPSILKSGDKKSKMENITESSAITSEHGGVGKGEGCQDIQGEGQASRGEGHKDTAPLISCELKHASAFEAPKTSTPKPESVSRSDDQSQKPVPFVKPKKVPPPPPPRKSSKHPSQVVSALISAPADNTGSVSMISPVKMEMSQPQHEMDSTKMLTSQDSSVLVGYQIGTSQPGVTMTSTPKPELLPKPSTKFEKGLALGLASEKYSEKTKDSGTLEKEKLADRKETDVKSCDYELKSEDRDSSESCSSLDSQGGVNVIVVNRRSSSSSLEGGVKKPKPPPPKRHSSLSGQPKSDVVTEQIPNGKSVSQSDGKSSAQGDGKV